MVGFACFAPASLNWTFTTGSDVSSGVVIDAAGYVYAPSEDNVLYKIDPWTGAAVWNFTGAEGAYDSNTPLLWQNLIIVGCFGDASVYAVDSTSGAQAWKASPTVSPASHPLDGVACAWPTRVQPVCSPCASS